VTLVAAARGDLPWRAVPGYVAAQFASALVGVVAAHAMFGEALFEFSSKVRTGPAQWLSEIVATFGLVLVIAGCARHGVKTVAATVGAYIAAAYWFTASTAFANPAVTIARATTDTFSGIRPADAIGFVFAQILGAAIAAVIAHWLANGRVEEDAV
jgi:glycerol uptake facilitator-like aquaporin